MLNITEVRVALEQWHDSHCKAHALVVIDNCFLVSGFRLIRGENGLFLATPDRAVTYPCKGCGKLTQFSHKFCPHCAHHNSWEDRPWEHLPGGAVKRYSSIAYPINRDTRAQLFEVIHQEYLKELGLANQRESEKTSITEEKE